MKILITGGTGFVGTPLVAELERQGITAMLVSRSNQTNHGTPCGQDEGIYECTR